jgi:hypothetical protein
LLDFYRGNLPDLGGRYIHQLWGQSHDQLEGCHDYIQWLFPSAQPSRFNAKAPLLDDETIAVWQAEVVLQQRLLKSLQVMLPFFGLELATVDGKPSFGKASNYEERRANWQEAPAAGYLNHNLLRLTRILEALRVLGLPEHAAALFACLGTIQKEESEDIPPKTLGFWRQAAGL